MLSHDEHQELDRIQQRMESDDPHLAHAFQRGVPPRPAWGVRTVCRGLEILAVGLIVLAVTTVNFGLVLLAALLFATAAGADIAGRAETALPAEGEASGAQSEHGF